MRYSKYFRRLITNKCKSLDLVSVVTICSVATSFLLVLFKLFAWLMTNSLSLQASLIDSSFDLTASFFAACSVQASKKTKKPIDVMCALVLAFFISISGVFFFYESITRLIYQQTLKNTYIGINVMLFALIITFALIFFQDYVYKKTNSLVVQADSLHYKSDLIMNIGIIISLCASGWMDSTLIDPLFAMGTSVYLLSSAYRIIIKAIKYSPETVDKLVQKHTTATSI